MYLAAACSSSSLSCAIVAAFSSFTTARWATIESDFAPRDVRAASLEASMLSRSDAICCRNACSSTSLLSACVCSCAWLSCCSCSSCISKFAAIRFLSLITPPISASNSSLCASSLPFKTSARSSPSSIAIDSSALVLSTKAATVSSRSVRSAATACSRAVTASARAASCAAVRSAIS